MVLRGNVTHYYCPYVSGEVVMREDMIMPRSEVTAPAFLWLLVTLMVWCGVLRAVVDHTVLSCLCMCVCDPGDDLTEQLSLHSD